MALYFSGKDSVATGTSLKTVFQIATTSTDRLKIVEFGISFDGTTATNAPVEVRLQRQSTAGTMTANNASPWAPTPLVAGDPASTATTFYNATAEPTAGVALRVWKVPPTSGLVIQFPLGQEVWMAVSDRLGVVCTAAVTVNAWSYLVWDE